MKQHMVPQHKAIAMGMYKSGGKVGRPQKRYVLETAEPAKEERQETKKAERAEGPHGKGRGV